MEISGGLLKRLCCHITNIGSNDERLLEHYQTSVMLLNDGDLLGDYPRSHSQVFDDIKKTLINEKRLPEAARVSVLLNRLRHSEVLKNKSSVLHLFLCLSRKNSQCSSRSDTGSEASAAFNGSSNPSLNLGNDYFQIPSIRSSVSRGGSSESALSHSSLNIEADPVMRNSLHNHNKESHGSGRVARLAAIYKEVPRQTTAEKTSPPSQGGGLITTKSVPPKPFHLNLKGHMVRKESQIEISEDILLREILFAFQGIEGKIIKMDSTKDCFKIDSKVRISPGKKDLIMKLIEVGWLYSKVKRFCEMQGRSSSMLKDTISGSGLVNQSLVLALREQLNEFCRLIAVLESQLNETPGHESPLGECSVGLTLRRLLMWTMEPRVNLRSLSIITHAVRETRGGASASAIYEHLSHGDQTHIQVILHALSQACQPLFVMLTEWLLVGNLQDPHHEFFIAEDLTIPNEKLWHDKYDIRWCMLPSFINHCQARKVLAAGKSLNFLRHVCNFKAPISGRDSIKAALQKTTVESLFTQDKTNLLDNLIALTFRLTSAHVLDEILSRHKLMEHLLALKRYLLMEQGDFSNHLMEIIEPLLSQPANKIHPHTLSSLLENAIAASNAQHEDPDIINRLDVRLLECSPGDTGWDVFSLDYHVDGPIGTVFTADCMRQYLMLFNTLWRAKHIEWILSATWKQQAATSKKCRALPELKDILHHLQILLTEMIHLVQQMSFYTTFEVLECSWHSLMTELKSAQSLDDIIGGHQKFLKNIIAGALLDEESEDVRSHLRSLYDLMVRLERLQQNLHHLVVKELTARETYENEKSALTRTGDFATCEEMEAIEAERRFSFNQCVTNTRTELKVLTSSYQVMVQSFLLMLAQHEDENLNLLSSRLDFNDFYHKKDERLNSRLTYLHKRKSMGASLCNSFCQDIFLD